jgi:hypothetical protein
VSSDPQTAGYREIIQLFPDLRLDCVGQISLTKSNTMARWTLNPIVNIHPPASISIPNRPTAKQNKHKHLSTFQPPSQSCSAMSSAIIVAVVVGEWTAGPSRLSLIFSFSLHLNYHILHKEVGRGHEGFGAGAATRQVPFFLQITI